MSNWKKAYGWIGHILLSDSDDDSKPEHNVVSVPARSFDALFEHYEEAKLDDRVDVRRIGVIDSDSRSLACGVYFSEGFEFYGTVFAEAEVRAAPGPEVYRDEEDYIAAMKESYGIDLPPCRIMVGCSVEH